MARIKQYLCIPWAALYSIQNVCQQYADSDAQQPRKLENNRKDKKAQALMAEN